MKCAQLAEDSTVFAAWVDQVRSSSAADRTARRRVEGARRRLIRSIVRICHLLSDDDLCTVSEYVLLITA